MRRSFEHSFKITQQGATLNLGGVPSALSAVAFSGTRIDLSWTIGSTNHTGHKIYISTDNITFTEKGTVLGATATYSATGLTADTLYFFKVVATLGSKESVSSNVAPEFTVTLTAIGTTKFTTKNYQSEYTVMGNAIPYVADNAAWIALTTPGWRYPVNNSTYNDAYGKLYNWYALVKIQADIDEYNALHPTAKLKYSALVQSNFTDAFTALGGISVAGGHMKETTLTYWGITQAGTDNSSGFNGRGAGFVEGTDGVNGYRNSKAGFWTLTAMDATRAIHYDLSHDDINARAGGYWISANKKNGLSVRLSKMTSEGIVIGDSTSTIIFAQNPVAYYLFTDAEKQNGAMVTSIAVSGDTCAQQKTRYLALANKARYDYVTLMIGINDLSTGSADVTVTIALLQDLINTINANKGAHCKIILCTVIPDRGAAEGAAYTRWLAFNEAIKGNVANPITGADIIVTSHTDALNDGNGYLKAEYEITGVVDHVHENNAARAIIAAAQRAAINTFSIIQ